MKPTCPLSFSKNVQFLESIDTSKIERLYQKKLNLSVIEEFKSVKKINFYRSVDSDLKFFSPMTIGSQSFYETLQGLEWYYLDEKYEYEYVRNWIKPSCLVLEVGCGKGSLARFLNLKSYVGLEYSENAKRIAEKDNVKVLNKTIQEHSMNRTCSYDVVCAFQVLEHVDNVHNFVRESVSCLKKNGLLIYSVPSADSFVALAKNNPLNMPPHHLTWWSDKSLQYLENIFPLELLELHHEPLAEIHFRWYISVLVLEALKQKLNTQCSLIDFTFKGQLLSKIAEVVSALISDGLANTKMRPIGHSVIAVYRKTS
ncbi:MAG: class I SAM-dependent methyltransferase [Leptolyngbya sp. SIOISBB]|nr:class I SAM-dependent methyltransferase [Leptolyngbya sp. SIOISBB]